MSRVALVLRPEPGASRTAGRLVASGMAVRRCPLFAVTPVAWKPPDPARYHALLLTSANAARHGGPGLRALDLPVLAVGEATADAARQAGCTVALTGEADAAALVAEARARSFVRLLHLAGRDRVDLPSVVPNVEQVTVYASDPLPIARDEVRAWASHLALLHSARAARRFAELVDEHRVDRVGIGVAALSAAVADAAGNGWACRAAAERPDDDALVSLACAIDRRWPDADKCEA